MVDKKYERQFKAAISLINSVAHVEESVREFRSCVLMTPKLISDGTTSIPNKRIVPVEYISERVESAVGLLKEANNAIEQVFVKKKGKDNVTDMSYSLIDMVNKLYCLSLEDQKEVFNVIKEKYELPGKS